MAKSLWHVGDRAFLPAAAPIEGLPAPFDLLYNLALEIPSLVNTGSFRTLIDSQETKLLNLASRIDELDGYGEDALSRAHACLSFLSVAYLRGWPEHTVGGKRSLPSCLARPWVAVSERLGRLPMLDYVDLVLYNWVVVDESKPATIDNVRMLLRFTGTMDEEWFYRVHYNVERVAAKVMTALNEMRAAFRGFLAVCASASDSHSAPVLKVAAAGDVAKGPDARPPSEMTAAVSTPSAVREEETVLPEDDSDASDYCYSELGLPQPLAAAPWADAVHFTTVRLQALANAIDEVASALMYMYSNCDYYAFYHLIRRYLNGFTVHPVVYSGVDEEPRKYPGPSGAMSSIMQCVDAFLGIEVSDDQLRTTLEGFRPFMPPAHRNLILALHEEGASVREFIAYVLGTSLPWRVPRNEEGERALSQLAASLGDVDPDATAKVSLERAPVAPEGDDAAGGVDHVDYALVYTRAVSQEQAAALVSAYNAAVAAVEKYRWKHSRFVTKYIVEQAIAAGEPLPVGTGGTEIGQMLGMDGPQASTAQQQSVSAFSYLFSHLYDSCSAQLALVNLQAENDSAGEASAHSSDALTEWMGRVRKQVPSIYASDVSFVKVLEENDVASERAVGPPWLLRKVPYERPQLASGLANLRDETADASVVLRSSALRSQWVLSLVVSERPTSTSASGCPHSRGDKAPGSFAASVTTRGGAMDGVCPVSGRRGETPSSVGMPQSVDALSALDSVTATVNGSQVGSVAPTRCPMDAGDGPGKDCTTTALSWPGDSYTFEIVGLDECRGFLCRVDPEFITPPTLPGDASASQSPSQSTAQVLPMAFPVSQGSLPSPSMDPPSLPLSTSMTPTSSKGPPLALSPGMPTPAEGIAPPRDLSNSPLKSHVTLPSTLRGGGVSNTHPATVVVSLARSLSAVLATSGVGRLVGTHAQQLHTAAEWVCDAIVTAACASPEVGAAARGGVSTSPVEEVSGGPDVVAPAGPARRISRHVVARVEALRSRLRAVDESATLLALTQRASSCALGTALPMYRSAGDDPFSSTSGAFDEHAHQLLRDMGVFSFHQDSVAAEFADSSLVAGGFAERLHSACALLAQALAAERQPAGSFDVQLPAASAHSDEMECVCGALSPSTRAFVRGRDKPATVGVPCGGGEDCEALPTCVCGGLALPLHLGLVPSSLTTCLRLLSVVLGIPARVGNTALVLTNWTTGTRSGGTLTEADAVSTKRAPQRLAWRLLGVEDEERMLLMLIRCEAAGRSVLEPASRALSAIQDPSLSAPARDHAVIRELASMEVALSNLDKVYEFPTNPRGENVLMRRLHRILFTGRSTAEMFGALFGAALPVLIVTDHALGIQMKGPLARLRTSMMASLPFSLRMFLQSFCRVEPNIRTYIVRQMAKRTPDLRRGRSRERVPAAASAGLPDAVADQRADERNLTMLRMSFTRALDAAQRLRELRSVRAARWGCSAPYLCF